MKSDQPNPFSQYISHLSHDNTMGLVRYFLALGVLIAHFNFIFDQNIPWVISSYDSVGGFFALSGFVLIGGLLKGMHWKKYIIKRAWRLLPSYFFVVVFFAVALSFISNLSFAQYFSSSGFWAYLAANISFLNFLHPSLPGVFEGDFSAVNASLWTMKIEWQLYISAPIAVWICRRYNIILIKGILAVIVVSILYRLGFAYLYDLKGQEVYEILGRQLFGQLIFFYSGILAFCKLEFLKKNIVNITLLLGSIYIIFTFFYTSKIYFDFLESFVVAFLVILLSLSPHDLSRYIDGGHNISYEIYLCHFPVIQTIRHFYELNHWDTGVCFALSVIFTILTAILIYVTVGRLYRKIPKKQTQPSSQPSTVE